MWLIIKALELLSHQKDELTARDYRDEGMWDEDLTLPLSSKTIRSSLLVMQYLNLPTSIVFVYDS